MNNTTDITELETPGVNVWGIVSVIIFYIVILLIGIYASWKTRTLKNQSSEQLMVGGRDFGLFVGIFTMTATWVGGGYINGTAEAVFTPGYGLVWAQAPVGFSLGLVMGGIFFARKMREKGYVTMLDPFNEKYGSVMTAFLFLPALSGDLFWSSAILSALVAAVIISACISVCYTLIGGLVSVAYTDVIQLICIFVGLWIGVGFALTHKAVVSLSETKSQWLGTLANDSYIGYFIDGYLLFMLGGIPWQVYFQRVLSSKTPQRAQLVSMCAAAGCIFLAAPPVLLGAIGASAKWNETEYARYYELPIPAEDYGLILPLVLQYLCPPAVAVIGLGAVSAAVMSSTDSSILAISSMFSRNVWTPIRNAITKSEASEREIIWVMRVAILVFGVMATIVAIEVNSIYGLFYLCGDFVYCILFPQLTCVVHFPWSNTYGALIGGVAGLVFRLIGGEPLLGLPAALKYPYYYCDEVSCAQHFPFRTLSMLISLCCIIAFSSLSHCLFTRNLIDTKYDIFNSFGNGYDLTKPKKEQYEVTGKVNEGYINGKVNATAVNGKVNETSLNGKVNATAVNGTVNETSLNGKVNATAVNGIVNETAVNGKVNEATANGTANQISVKNCIVNEGLLIE